MAEAVEMNYFEVLALRFSSATGTRTVIDAKASYFTHITSYAK